MSTIDDETLAGFYRRIDKLTAECERLQAERDKARRHPMAPDKCPVCDWTNVNLMNYGSPEGGSRWMCHGCAARAMDENSTLRTRQAELEKEVEAMRGSLMHACELQRESYENRRELWAIRQTANKTDLPFTHDRVIEEYDKLGEQADAIARLEAIDAQLQQTQADFGEMEHERDLALAASERMRAVYEAALRYHRSCSGKHADETNDEHGLFMDVMASAVGDCVVNDFSSRSCERGTRSCVVRHAALTGETP